MYNINAVCDYVIFRLKSDEDMPLDNIKLQKLLYYIQAWNLAYDEVPFFDGKFQAWIHGPVNREIYNRFKETKYLYSDIKKSDIISSDFNNISEEDKTYINNVLEVYAKYSGTALESMTHEEEPWIQARKGYSSTERCEVEIDESLMGKFYRKRLS